MVYIYKPIRHLSEASLLQISCLRGFYNLNLVDPNDFSSPHKTTKILVINVHVYMPQGKPVQDSICEISSLQGRQSKHVDLSKGHSCSEKATLSYPMHSISLTWTANRYHSVVMFAARDRQAPHCV